VKGNTELHYDPKLDPRATEADVDARLAERLELSSIHDASIDDIDLMAPEIAVGDYLTAGAGAVRFETSIGNGKGSTVMVLGGSDLASVVKALHEPVIDLERLPVAESIRRTIARNPAADGSPATITFKLSLAKHSRSIVVPESDWSAFVAYVETLDAKVSDAVDHSRRVVAAAEKVK
jgi:hypothetical protein